MRQMNITSLNETLSLLGHLSDTRKTKVSSIPYDTNKPVVVELEGNAGLEQVSPESMGIESQKVLAWLKELNEDYTLNMHDLVLIRDGRIICQVAFGEQSLKNWKYTFSACKSVTAIAVGMLMDEGRLHLGDKVLSFFEEYSNPVLKIKLKDLTVEHLLTMTSGVVFNEAECKTTPDWVHGFLNSMVRTEPGKVFSYNSLNTYMLSAIVRKVAGEDMSDFLRKRLFDPLEIRDFYWEKCPKGITIGGWGLYIHPVDFAKIGMMMLDGGVYKGKRILYEKFVQAATTKKRNVPREYGSFNYGYQIWTGRDGRSFLFNGMLGQNVLCFRESRIIIVSNAGNSESFQQSNYFKTTLKYFGKDKYCDCELQPDGSYKINALQENPINYLKLVDYVNRLDTGDEQRPVMRFWTQLASKIVGNFPKEAEELVGKTWYGDSPFCNSMGVMPFCLQSVQSNFSGGLESVGFEKEDGNLVFVYTQKDATYRFPIGFSGICTTDQVFGGQPYRVAVTGRFGSSEEGTPMLRIQLSFVETPFTRMIKFYFLADNKIEMIQTENPGEIFVKDYIYGMKSDYESKPLIGNALAKIDLDYVEFRVERVFTQKIRMLDTRPLSEETE